MRIIMGLVVASALALCFMDPASAARNPDRSARSAEPWAGQGCAASGSCYRSRSQKIQKKHHRTSALVEFKAT
jgi:hypothetical protein